MLRSPLSLLQAEQPQTRAPDPSPAPLPFPGCGSAPQCPSRIEGPRSEHSTQCGHTSAQYRGTITSLVLLATLFQIEATMALPFLPTRARLGLVFRRCRSAPPGPFPLGRSSLCSVPDPTPLTAPSPRPCPRLFQHPFPSATCPMPATPSLHTPPAIPHTPFVPRAPGPPLRTPPPAPPCPGPAALTVQRHELPHGGGAAAAVLHELHLGHDDVVLQHRPAARAHRVPARRVHLDLRAPAGAAHPPARHPARCTGTGPAAAPAAPHSPAQPGTARQSPARARHRPRSLAGTGTGRSAAAAATPPALARLRPLLPPLRSAPPSPPARARISGVGCSAASDRPPAPGSSPLPWVPCTKPGCSEHHRAWP